MIKNYDIIFLHEVDTNCYSWDLLKENLQSCYKLELPNGCKKTELLKGRKSISCAFINNKIEKLNYKISISSENFSGKLKNVEIDIEDVSIVGVHVPINKEYWNKLLNIKVDIILGDFNAGDYNKATKMSEYKTLLRMGYFDVCNGVITTKYNTPIDHILVLNKYKDKCFNPTIHYDIRLSDHYPISFELIVN